MSGTNPINFFDPDGMEGEAAASDSSETGGGGESGTGGPGGPGGDPPIRTQNIQPVVITVYRPLAVKPQGVQVSTGMALGAISFMGSRSLNPIGLLAAAAATFTSAMLQEDVYHAISAYHKEEITVDPNNPSETLEKIAGKADIEEVVVPRAPKAKDDSGYKLPRMYWVETEWILLNLNPVENQLGKKKLKMDEMERA